MRKYHVVDDDGSSYQVEEFDDDVIEEQDVNTLSDDEIEALKRLASVADKLLAKLNDEDNMEENNLEDEDEEEEEKVVDTEEDLDDEDEDEEDKKTTHDSKKSFGSLESKKKAKVEDTSLVDEVSDAWSKRYGGIK